VYGNILEIIYRVAEEALGNQEKRKNSKLCWTDKIDQLVKEKSIISEMAKLKIRRRRMKLHQKKKSKELWMPRKILISEEDEVQNGNL